MAYQNGLEEADWINEGEEAGDRGRWRRHLRRQLARMAIVAMVVFSLRTLKTAGRPGQWLLARLRTAVSLDFSGEMARFWSAEKVRKILAAFRDRLAREWQVNGPSLRSQAGPPPLFLPLDEASPVAPAELPLRNLGLDLRAPAGSLVLAAAAGTVEEIRSEQDGSFTVVLHHGDGWRTIYERCRTALVSPGAFVSPRQPIGVLGSAPPPMPSYLHFELWQGSKSVDPRGLLRSGSI
ncbi:MAG: murein hydrolase activator EnvC family protein [Bacillota bacterium]